MALSADVARNSQEDEEEVELQSTSALGVKEASAGEDSTEWKGGSNSASSLAFDVEDGTFATHTPSSNQNQHQSVPELSSSLKENNDTIQDSVASLNTAPVGKIAGLEKVGSGSSTSLNYASFSSLNTADSTGRPPRRWTPKRDKAHLVPPAFRASFNSTLSPIRRRTSSSGSVSTRSPIPEPCNSPKNKKYYESKRRRRPPGKLKTTWPPVPVRDDASKEDPSEIARRRASEVSLEVPVKATISSIEHQQEDSKQKMLQELDRKVHTLAADEYASRRSPSKSQSPSVVEGETHKAAIGSSIDGLPAALPLTAASEASADAHGLLQLPTLASNDDVFAHKDACEFRLPSGGQVLPRRNNNNLNRRRSGTASFRIWYAGPTLLPIEELYENNSIHIRPDGGFDPDQMDSRFLTGGAIYDKPPKRPSRHVDDDWSDYSPYYDDEEESQSLEGEDEKRAETGAVAMQRDHRIVGYNRPDVWVTPMDIADGDSNAPCVWRIKRVWGVPALDELEPEHEVDDADLMEEVRALLGVPLEAPVDNAQEPSRFWRVRKIYGDQDGFIDSHARPQEEDYGDRERRMTDQDLRMGLQNLSLEVLVANPPSGGSLTDSVSTLGNDVDEEDGGISSGQRGRHSQADDNDVAPTPPRHTVSYYSSAPKGNDAKSKEMATEGAVATDDNDAPLEKKDAKVVKRPEPEAVKEQQDKSKDDESKSKAERKKDKKKKKGTKKYRSIGDLLSPPPVMQMKFVETSGEVSD